MNLSVEKYSGGMELSWHHHDPSRVFFQRNGRLITKRNSNTFLVITPVGLHFFTFLYHYDYLLEKAVMNLCFSLDRYHKSNFLSECLFHFACM